MDPRAWVEFPFIPSSGKQREDISLKAKKALIQSRGPKKWYHKVPVWQGVTVPPGSIATPSFVSFSKTISEHFDGFFTFSAKFLKNTPGPKPVKSPHDGTGINLAFSVTSSAFPNVAPTPISCMLNQTGIGESFQEWSYYCQDLFQATIYNSNKQSVFVWFTLNVTEIRW